MSSLVITTNGCGPSRSVLLILEPVTLIFVNSTSSSDAVDAGSELSVVTSCSTVSEVCSTTGAESSDSAVTGLSALS